MRHLFLFYGLSMSLLYLQEEEQILLEKNGWYLNIQDTICIWIIMGLLVGIVFIVLYYHFRLRISIEHEKKLIKEKKELERKTALQLSIEKEEKAQLQSGQELLEIKRKRLEEEALANALIIEHKNEILKQIQERIQDGTHGNIRILLKEEKLMSADFEEIKKQIQALHSDFFILLSEVATRKLTPLDLKYCAYIYLNMNTKQIAQILHVETQSVRMFKYRLKQKFGLSKKDDLETFIRNLTASAPN